MIYTIRELYVFLLMLIILLCAKHCNCQQLIAKDSNGLIVEIKEKYGNVIYDSCTIIMKHDGDFVVIHRDGTVGRYPETFHSLRVWKRKP